MAFSFQGAYELVQENREKEEKRKERLLSFKTSALDSYLKNRSASSGNAAQKAADLLALSKILPENSPILSELSGASAETIKGVKEAVYANRDAYSSSNMTYTPEMAEDELEISRVEIENNPDLDLADFYKDAFSLTEEDLDDKTGGLTLREMLNTPETSDIGISYSIKKPPKPIDAGEASSFNKLLPDLLAPVIASEKNQVDSQIAAAEGNVSSDLSDRADVLEQAEKALGNKDYTKAIQIAGPEIAIKLMERSPQYKDLNFMVNRGLIFPETNQGHELVARSIRSGLLQLGDTYQMGNDMRRVNQNQIDLIFGS
tara:strand:- start:151 stop:1098 length:948 start_codon:yes stop_codon:yes gene_type:complete